MSVLPQDYRRLCKICTGLKQLSRDGGFLHAVCLRYQHYVFFGVIFQGGARLLLSPPCNQTVRPRDFPSQ